MLHVFTLQKNMAVCMTEPTHRMHLARYLYIIEQT